MAGHSTELWDLWYPQAAATGLAFARCRVDPVEVMLVHALPPVVTVAVRTAEGTLVAEGAELAQTADTPIARLTRHGATIRREDIWPTDEDLGHTVLLPGGEAGTLVRWWHAPDHSEWRWQIELYNHR